MRIGPTGQFPEGRLNQDDEGEIAIAICADHGNVVIQFGKPVAWLAMPPEQAESRLRTRCSTAPRK